MKRSVKSGESFAIGPYQLRYAGLDSIETPHLETVRAKVVVMRDGREVATMAPAKLFYKAAQQPATDVAIRSTPAADLYLVLAGFDDASATATFQVFLTPLVFWIWLGGFVMALGTVVAMWPNVRERAAIAATVRSRLPDDRFASEPVAGGR